MNDKGLEIIGGSYNADELYAILERNCFLYTMGESTTLPEETARELMLSILYCVRLHGTMHPGAAASSLRTGPSLRAAYEAGVEDAKALTKRARLLHSDASRHAPAALIACAPFKETLDAVSTFFALYDAQLFAHAIPCELVYPLCRPVEERVQGIEYILSYLRTLNAESDILARFPQTELANIFHTGLGYYEEQVVNLCAPAVENALGCALIGLDPLHPGIDESGRRELADALIHGETAPMLNDAAGAVCSALHIEGAARGLVFHITEALAPRLDAALSSDEKTAALSGIFFAQAVL